MHVTLYTRPGCHLCEDLKTDLFKLQQEIDFTIVERNIEDAAEDFTRYRYLIPVLDVAGGEVLFPPHDKAIVRRALLTAHGV